MSSCRCRVDDLYRNNPHVGERFTEFYILGPSGRAEGYPTDLKIGESGTVIIGVVNHEYEEVSYRIVIVFGNETIGAIDGIRLKHEELWQQNYTFTPEKTGERMKLEFLLYKEDVEEPYRTLHLWVTAHPRQDWTHWKPPRRCAHNQEAEAGIPNNLNAGTLQNINAGLTVQLNLTLEVFSMTAEL